MANYFGVSIDSTPDISHIDQLTVVIRFAQKDGQVVERFLGFIPIEQHSGECTYLTFWKNLDR